MIIRIRRKTKQLYTVGEENLINKVLEYLLCFFVIICTTGIWLRYGATYSYIIYLKLIIPVTCVILAIIKLIKVKKLRVSVQVVLWSLFFCACLCPSFFSEFPGYSNTVYILFTLLAFLLLAYLMDTNERKKIWDKFINIVFVISLISLFFYLFGSILKLIGSSGTVQYVWDWERTAVNYFNLYYAPTSQLSDTFVSGVQRNCGIFTEGTMFAFYLSIAYMMESQKGKNRLYVKIILLITLITTFSSTGIVAIVIFEGVRLLCSKPKGRFLKICKIIYLPLTMLAIIIALVNLTSTKMSTGSYGVRYDHMITCFQVFLKTFPVGLGYGGVDTLKSYYTYSQGTSVGLPSLVAYGGLGGACLIIIPTVMNIYYSIKWKEWSNLAFTLSFTWIIFITNIVFNSTLQWMILAFVYIKGGYDIKKNLLTKDV